MLTAQEADLVFGALADRTRRTVLERLLDGGPATATELAAGAPVTRQAVVKHLQLLEAAGLVRSERAGREVRYAATTDALLGAASWLARAGAAWDRRLARLQRQLGATPAEPPAPAATSTPTVPPPTGATRRASPAGSDRVSE